VLRPGGTFAAIWNVRDDSEPWVRQLSRIAGGPGYSADDLTRGVGDFGPGFDPAERAEFRHRTRLTQESLIGMVRTRSYWLTADDGRRRELEQAVRDLATGHPDLAGRESFELPYRTLVFRSRRR
ncbi:MAG TPA: class I SAM-dependent methyltransferase, partial [Micromonospora sp.]